MAYAFTTLFMALFTASIVVVCVCLYFAPFIVAWIRNQNLLAVFLVNLFTGWSLIGWIVALVMATVDKPATTQQVVYVQGKAPVDPNAALPLAAPLSESVEEEPA